jgi:phytanoyl-CoA hydroxylase
MAPSRVSPPPSSDLSSGLTKEQLEFWHTNGYLLIPDALSQDTVKELHDESNRLLNDFSLDDHPMPKFSTGEKSDHVGDAYFLESGDKVRFFFEEGIVEPHIRSRTRSLSNDILNQTPSTPTAP